jgi:hypothetical protein
MLLFRYKLLQQAVLQLGILFFKNKKIGALNNIYVAKCGDAKHNFLTRHSVQKAQQFINYYNERRRTGDLDMRVEI